MVPTALLEHWFEQIRRHVDLRCLQRRSDGAAGRGSVWIDGMGDIADLGTFRLRASDLASSDVADEYTLASHTIVLTTYERCARERAKVQHGGTADSPLMRLRWLRLVVDEGQPPPHTARQVDMP